jgi:2-dehydropantoate 2-reductase
MAADPLLKTHVLATMHEILHLATVVLQSPLPSKFATPEKIIESTLRNTIQNFNKGGSQSKSDETKGESSRPSMWYDWAQGRPMELEAVLGNVVHEAERVGVQVPRTQSMYALLCMAQKRRDEQNKKSVQSKL